MSARIVKKLADLRMPHEWWEKTRSLSRNFHLHLGPTNSGKTFYALEKLKKSKKGVYCGPLRLLATEISEKLNSAGVKCSLFTGQETRIVPGATHVSCTVESLNLDAEYDCALIDEVQMIDDYARGSAWTYAVLGLYSPEIHITGDPRSRKILESLLEKTGDSIVNYSYKRLSPLSIVPPVTSLVDLKAGDCLVAFSRLKCHTLKNYIEKMEPGSCSIIYGKLPPQVRIDQAEKFNSGTHKYLVSTDAIGMGLNYNINRVIFTETKKNNGFSVKPLTPTEIKQISGRAGRFKSKGFVTASSLKKLTEVSIGLHFSHPSYIAKAALSPMYEQIEEFVDLYSLQNESFSYLHILNRFKKEVKLESLYFLQSFTEACEIAKGLSDLQLPHKITHGFCTANINVLNSKHMRVIKEYAAEMKSGKPATFKSFSDDLEALDLLTLETLFNMCETYNSLARKFGFKHFRENAEVLKFKQEISDVLQRKISIESEKSIKTNFKGNGELDIF